MLIAVLISDMSTPTLIVSILVGSVAGLTALGYLWKKVIKPVAKLITDLDTMLPLLANLNAVFGQDENSNTLEVLNTIAAQFRTDSGSSLRDVVNRLEELATTGKLDADTLKVSIEAAKQLAQIDRDKLDKFFILIDRLTAKVDAGALISAHNEEMNVRAAEQDVRANADAMALQIEAAQARAKKEAGEK